MGCCASTGAPSISRHVDVSKSPPTAEEEAVKEVLSETPHHKPTSPNPYLYNLNTFVPNNSLTTSNNGFLSMTSPLDSAPKTLLYSPRKQIDEIPDARHRMPRSPSPGSRRERLTGKSPVKRSDPSPRRNGSGQVVGRDRFGGSDVQRKREPGENSGRRSRSPATRNEGGGSKSDMGRSPSGRKTGLSPGKIRMVQPGIGPGAGVGSCGRDSWETDPTAPSESLENPLVSLECFIFL